ATVRPPHLHRADRAADAPGQAWPGDGVLAMSARTGSKGLATTPPPGGDPVAWHDAENGAYTADLGLWKRLAEAQPGGVADLGSGTGRVARPSHRAGDN